MKSQKIEGRICNNILDKRRNKKHFIAGGKIDGIMGFPLVKKKRSFKDKVMVIKNIQIYITR